MKSVKKPKEKDLRFKQTLSALPEGVVLVKKDWEIEWLNPTAATDLGLDENTALGQKLDALLTDASLASYLTAEPGVEPYLHESAHAKMVEVRVINAGSKYKVVLTHDVTATLQAQAFRRNFVADVSHELRTPLTVIRGFLELAEDKPGNTEEDKVHLRMMREQTERMANLLDDLLTLSRLERDKEKAVLEPVDVAQILREAAAEGQVISQGRHTIALLDASPLKILGEASEIRSAVTNLVTNAIRYTPSGGSIELSWQVSPTGGVICVKDNGIGIAAKDLLRLTERFYRVDKSRSRGTGGTGLGLAIVKHVLERHQCTLKIASSPGEGSEFLIQVPLARLQKS